VTHVEPTSFGLSGHGRSVAGGLRCVRTGINE
jgi:hypothetical protein